MKVAFLVPGGVDRSGEYRVIPCLVWLIERLARAHDLHVFALRQEPGPVTFALGGATIHVVGRRPHRLRMARAILSENRRGRFDLLHAVWAVPSGVVAGVVGHILRLPVLLHVTGGDLARLPDIGYGSRTSWSGRAAVGFAIRRASSVTTPSAEMQRTAAGLGFRAERLPLGVALDRWPVRAPARADPGPARLIHVASLNPVKDQATLMRGAAVLRERGVAFRLDLVGEDTMSGEIQALCRTLGLGDIVTFHGFLPHRELRPLVERARLLVMTSRHEADPVVMLEAAVAGVPTVGTPVGHMVDWAPEAAVVFAFGDPEGLADAVERVLRSEDRRLELAANAQARAVAEDADWTAKRVLTVYGDCARTREEGVR